MKRDLLIGGLLALGAMILPEVNAIAAHENGNGGNIVYCAPSRDRGIFDYEQTLFLLDYLEGEKLRGQVFDVARPLEARNWTLEDYRQVVLDAFIQRIGTYDEGLAEGWNQRLRTFFDEALIVDLNLDPVDDSLHVGIPAGCRIEQAAVQQTPVFPEDKRYLISKGTWPTGYVREPCRADFCIYPPDEYVQKLHFDRAKFQAGLMIHEVIFRRALELGYTDSVRVRYFNAFIMSQKFHDLDESGWLELRRITGL